MSRTAEHEPPVCEFCGAYILKDGQSCAALKDERCQP